MAKKEKIENQSKTWQTICEKCGSLRRPNETPIVLQRCVFCWPISHLHTFWYDWLLHAFNEGYAFEPNEKFGDHQNHAVYARRDARIALAACKYAKDRDHHSAIRIALNAIEKRLQRLSGLHNLRRLEQKLEFFRVYQRCVMRLLNEGLIEKRITKEELITPLGLAVEVQEAEKEKPLIRKIHRWKATETSQLGFRDVLNAQIQARCLYDVYLLWSHFSLYAEGQAMRESARMPNTQTPGRYDHCETSAIDQ